MSEEWPEDLDDDLVFDIDFFPHIREPTIMEMMVIFRFFMNYGHKSNLMDQGGLFGLTGSLDLPDSVFAYILWMGLRDQG